MPSRRPRQRLYDILKNVDRIRRHVGHMAYEDYLADEKACDAVERCFQRITEAATKLGERMDERYPDVPWRDIRGFGNVLRHDYDEVRNDLIWITIQDRLNALRRACEAEIRRLPEDSQDNSSS